jgi:multidrug transporter EmrE-like cation transporter
MKKKNKKRWKKYIVVFIAGLIAIAWVSLIKEGYRLPIARRLSEVIPTWIMILNLVILIISFSLLTLPYPKKISEIWKLLNFIVFTLSGIFFSMSAKHLPFVVVTGATVIMLISLIVGRSIDNKGEKKK